MARSPLVSRFDPLRTQLSSIVRVMKHADKDQLYLWLACQFSRLQATASIEQAVTTISR
jgi:hypothetical protein